MLRIPNITKNLLIINILVFIAMLVLRQIGVVDLNDIFGLHFFMASDFHVYQLLTYMFMHAGWEHIIVNMFMLWMFGAVMEQVWGAKRFIFYYIVWGVGAGIMQELAQFFYVWHEFNVQQSISITESFSVMAHFSTQLNGLTTVGASGAIYALLLAFGMTFPEERMFIIPIPIPIKAKWMVMGSIALELFLTLSAPGDQVAHLAHLGGIIFGFFLIRYWRKHPNMYYGMNDGIHMFKNMRNRWEDHQRKSDYSSHSKNNVSSTSYTEKDNNITSSNHHGSADSQEEVDRILDKIRKSGYVSLSKEEKQTLFDQSRK